jgi:hypothetical protein
MGEKFTTQRATKVAAGGFPVAIGCRHAIKLNHFRRQHFLAKHIRDFDGNGGFAFGCGQFVFALHEIGFLFWHVSQGDVENFPIVRVSPHINIQPFAYLACMKNHKIVNCVAISALALSFLLVGCARQVSSEKSSAVSSDGTVKTKEKTVTKSSDGTVTKTEDTKKTTPPPNP